MSPAAQLVANLGAEEDLGAAVHALPGGAAATLATLWQALFEPPAFDWLPQGDVAVAWLNTEAALREARENGRQLYGAAPGVVASVHDKNFARAQAERAGLVPAPLAGLCSSLEPALLADADAAVGVLEERVAGWPDWARRSFTLKPRFGSSGRGRVAGKTDNVDTPALRGAFPRLAAAGGALLEPWLERVADLSVQLQLDTAGALRLVGSTRPWLTPAGLYRGQRGGVDVRGRVQSGSLWDEALREAAAALAGAAAAEGFFGPCGLDAFVFRGPDGGDVLRPVVEWNARFTAGHVAIGWVRRSLPAVVAHFGLEPGECCEFLFTLDSSPTDASDVFGAELPGNGTSQPGLFFARNAGALDTLVNPRRHE